LPDAPPHEFVRSCALPNRTSGLIIGAARRAAGEGVPISSSVKSVRKPAGAMPDAVRVDALDASAAWADFSGCRVPAG
jgi:hypothetical protein